MSLATPAPTKAKWNAAAYAANSVVQHSWARELIAKLKLHGNEHVLDVGCGDGKITAEIARALPQGSVVGTDASAEMIGYARKTFPPAQNPNLEFHVMDAREIKFARQFEVVFSNAALHWVDDHAAILRGAAAVLKPGGRLVVSCGGKGNAHDVFLALRPEMRLKRWRQFFRQMPMPYFFYAPGDYEQWLPKFGFKIKALKLAPKDAHYPGAAGFATWLRTTWIPYVQRVPEAVREEFIRAVTERYLAKYPPDQAGQVHVRMVRLEIEAQKLWVLNSQGWVQTRNPCFSTPNLKFKIRSADFRSIKMKTKFKEIAGSIVAPQGFMASGVFCDIKKLGTGKGSNKGPKRDLALIVSETPATVAGLFTTNQVCAAPVKVCAERMKTGTAQVIVVNSGNANACTGKQGMADARMMVSFAEKTLALSAGRALVGSTGRIGVTMPMDNIRAGILEAAMGLGVTPAHAGQAAEAIMTSDTRPKQIAVEFKLGGKTVCIGGICKGAGMIQPGMSATGKRPAALPHGGLHATMLCFITTDAAIDAKTLQAALNEAVANSFNRITVDGDMSTNDTVLVLANGLAGNEKLKAKNSKSKIFQAALNHVCLELAKKIVRDGEGVHRVVTVRVNGAKTIQDADAAARAVANSALVKTSWHGGDPNWGRIIDAIGYSPATVVEEKIDIGYAAPGSKKILWSLKRGQPTKATFKQLCAAVAPKEFELHINLHLGKANAVMYAADLTEEYVDFNKGDVTDPTTLGG